MKKKQLSIAYYWVYSFVAREDFVSIEFPFDRLRVLA